MITFIVIGGLIVAIVTAVISGRRRFKILSAGLILIGLTVACFMFLSFGPKDYMIRYPFSANVFHPYRIGLYGAIMLILGSGMVIGLFQEVFLNAFLSLGRKTTAPNQALELTKIRRIFAAQLKRYATETQALARP